MATCVLVTEKEYHKGQAVFTAERDLEVISAPANEQSLAAWVEKKPCRAVIVGSMSYTGTLYKALSKAAGDQGCILARFGVGHDGIDKAQAHRYHITVTNTAGALDASVAELTVFLLGNLARRVSALDAAVHEGDASLAEPGVELHGKTLVVVGLGAIGRRVAAMAHFGLGMRVLAVGRRSIQQLARQAKMPAQTFRKTFGVETCTDDVDAVLPEADAVSLHLPATSETRGFLDAARLGRIKPGAMLVNTARGSLVDESALYAALTGGKLRGAALDVFAQEPYKPASARKDLRKLPNVVMTPHIGSHTAEANLRMARQSLANVRNFLAGKTDELDVVRG